jgi:hypothetical protein
LTRILAWGIIAPRFIATLEIGMRIIVVKQNLRIPTSLLCCHCSEFGATLADLDGEPFKAYYHETCLENYKRNSGEIISSTHPTFQARGIL